MRTLFLLFILNTFLFQAEAQIDIGSNDALVSDDAIGGFKRKENDSQDVFYFVGEMPVFPGGGDSAFYSFIKKNLTYPADAKEKGITGIVYVKFIIEKDGCVSSIHIAPGRGLSPSLDQSAIDVIAFSPEWTPGKSNGKKVRVGKVARVKFE